MLKLVTTLNCIIYCFQTLIFFYIISIYIYIYKDISDRIYYYRILSETFDLVFFNLIWTIITIGADLEELVWLSASQKCT